MLNVLMDHTEHIYLAIGATDFRKQVEGLVAIVNKSFQLDAFSPTCVFIFCIKKRNAIKVLRYDKNGFILATKKKALKELDIHAGNTCF